MFTSSEFSGSDPFWEGMGQIEGISVKFVTIDRGFQESKGHEWRTLIVQAP